MRIEQSQQNPEWYHVIDSEGHYVLCNVPKHIAIKYLDERKKNEKKYNRKNK